MKKKGKRFVYVIVLCDWFATVAGYSADGRCTKRNKKLHIARSSELNVKCKHSIPLRDKRTTYTRGLLKRDTVVYYILYNTLCVN